MKRFKRKAKVKEVSIERDGKELKVFSIKKENVCIPLIEEDIEPFESIDDLEFSAFFVGDIEILFSRENEVLTLLANGKVFDEYRVFDVRPVLKEDVFYLLGSDRNSFSLELILAISLAAHINTSSSIKGFLVKYVPNDKVLAKFIEKNFDDVLYELRLNGIH